MVYNNSNTISVEGSDNDEDYVEQKISSRQKSKSKKSSRVKPEKHSPKLQKSVQKASRTRPPASKLKDLYKTATNEDDINVSKDCLIEEEEELLSQDLFENDGDQGLVIK